MSYCLVPGLSLAFLLCTSCSNLLPGPFGAPFADLGLTDLGPAAAERLVVVPPPGSPPMQKFSLIGRTQLSLDFRALLIHDGPDGGQTDVTDSCSWTVVAQAGQQVPLGTIQNGHFAATLEVAGTGEVRADYQDLHAALPIILQLQAVHTPSADDASVPPQGSPSQFTGALTPAKAPILLYPPMGPGSTLLPQNLNGLEVQWQAQGGTDLHEVSITGTYLDLRIYSTSKRRLTLAPQEYTLLLDAGLYGDVSVKVRGGNQSGLPTYGESAHVDLKVTPPVVGATYYFSVAKPGQGIWRYDWASSAGVKASAYATDTTLGKCVGCHSLSNDGSVMSVAFDMDNLLQGGLFNVMSGVQKFVPTTAKWEFSATAYAGDKVLINGGGALQFLSVNQATLDNALATSVGAGMVAEQPALSADGQYLVFVRAKQVAGRSEVHLTGGSLVRMTLQNGTFVNPTDIVTASGTENNYYPAITPDNKWVLFTKAPSGDSYDNTSADLWAVPLDGSRSPIRMASASSSLATTNPAVRSYLTNSFARVSPLPVMVYGKPVYYFTFSSRREYGMEITHQGTTPAIGTGTTKVLDTTTGPGTTLGGWQDQVWISTFDPDLAQQGLDPSSPALWFPFQAPLSSNHTATFTQVLISQPLQGP